MMHMSCDDAIWSMRNIQMHILVSRCMRIGCLVVRNWLRVPKTCSVAVLV